MKQLFIKGFVFGSGFCCAVLVFVFVVKILFENSSSAEFVEFNNDRLEWNNLSDTDKLKRSTDMLVVRYKDGVDSIKLAYVDKIYCKETNCDSEFSEGEILPNQDFYPKSDHSIQDAVILLLKSPRQLPMSKWFVYDNRVPTLGNMPINVLVKKFKYGP